jgi:hypothetical protein
MMCCTLVLDSVSVPAAKGDSLVAAALNPCFGTTQREDACDVARTGRQGSFTVLVDV